MKCPGCNVWLYTRSSKQHASGCFIGHLHERIEKLENYSGDNAKPVGCYCWPGIIGRCAVCQEQIDKGSDDSK